MITTKGPTFLYPKTRQFPFDEACEQIVRSLEERNWSVPGITVEFDVFGNGSEKSRFVRSIKGADFKLYFSLNQSRHTSWSVSTAVTQINIPQKELHVFDDESGPTYFTYVGENWKSDSEEFLSESKFNSKLTGKPRTYLRYVGGCDCRVTAGASFPALDFLTAALFSEHEAVAAMYHTHMGARAPLLVHNNDMDREYDLQEGDEPDYHTDDVFAEFTRWLENDLLARIHSHPIPSEKTDVFLETALPIPDSLGSLFCFGEAVDAQRIKQGKLDITALRPSDHYGLSGNGYRLLNLGVADDGSFPKVAYDGFTWCGLGEVSDDTPIETLTVLGYHWSSRKDRYVFKVTPNRANGIFIADHAPYVERRSELFEAIKPRLRLTDKELAEAERARARTIVPIGEYTGGYKLPIVLVNRELGFDEVELISGPSH